MTNFYSFPYLPTELRFQIWESAVRPLGNRIAGIQNFSFLPYPEQQVPEVSSNSSKSLPCKPICFDTFVANQACVPVIPKFLANDKGNCSAYLWDYGLWTACKESRRVIMRSFHVEKWMTQGHQDYSHCEECMKGNSCEKHFELCKVISAPSLQSRESAENWNLIVRPYQDAFCLDYEALVSSLPFCSLSHSDWRKITSYLPFGQDSIPVKHLILEFNPDWFGGPTGYAYAKVFGNLLWAIAHGLHDCFLWLIDRQERSSDESFEPSRSKDSATRELPSLFYNCEEEFVEIGSGYGLSHDEPGAAYFVQQANVDIQEFIRFISQRDPEDIFESQPKFNVWDRVRILGPKQRKFS